MNVISNGNIAKNFAIFEEAEENFAAKLELNLSLTVNPLP